jgi:voltage-gated potassium channel
LLVVVLWLLFIADYLLEVVIAPDRAGYVKSHWLSGIALLIPAVRFLAVLRSLRLLRSLRVIRTVSLARLLTSTNRGLRSVRAFFRGSQFGFVIAASALVTFGGAAAIYFFEGSNDGEIRNFGDALWWSSMMLTTMGSQYWPLTWEGRVVAWLLALYAFAIFGYVTARLASHFLGRQDAS